jgi:hypothetical protein
MVPRRDTKQWEDACREVGLDKDEEQLASDDFHAESERRETGAIGPMEI